MTDSVGHAWVSKQSVYPTIYKKVRQVYFFASMSLGAGTAAKIRRKVASDIISVEKLLIRQIGFTRKSLLSYFNATIHFSLILCSVKLLVSTRLPVTDISALFSALLIRVKQLVPFDDIQLIGLDGVLSHPHHKYK